jgi:hypothetical protein
VVVAGASVVVVVNGGAPVVVVTGGTVVVVVPTGDDVAARAGSVVVDEPGDEVVTLFGTPTVTRRQL